jgi:death-on-curing protein
LADESVFGEDDVVFLTVDQVISLHQESIRRYSPTESLNILDRGLLESAVMTLQQTFRGQYLYQTLPEMAAAYLVGLTLNHAFENGNKRIGFAVCSTFLRLNGYRLTLSQDAAVDLTLHLISHELTREDVIDILGSAIGLI